MGGGSRLSLEQLGDIYRERASSVVKPDDPNAKADYDRARQLFNEVHDIRQNLHDNDPENPAWSFGLSQILVRMGDLKVKPDKNDKGAEEDYDSALAIITEVIRRQSDNVDYQRELSWDLNKAGDVRTLSAPRSRTWTSGCSGTNRD